MTSGRSDGFAQRNILPLFFGRRSQSTVLKLCPLDNALKGRWKDSCSEISRSPESDWFLNLLANLSTTSCSDLPYDVRNGFVGPRSVRQAELASFQRRGRISCTPLENSSRFAVAETLFIGGDAVSRV
jgi:hypothetical protein